MSDIQSACLLLSKIFIQFKTEVRTNSGKTTLSSEVLRRQNEESTKLLLIINHVHSLQLGSGFCNTVIKVLFGCSSVMFAFNSFVNEVRLFSKFLSKKFKHSLSSKNSYLGFDLDGVFLNNRDQKLEILINFSSNKVKVNFFLIKKT